APAREPARGSRVLLRAAPEGERRDGAARLRRVRCAHSGGAADALGGVRRRGRRVRWTPLRRGGADEPRRAGADESAGDGAAVEAGVAARAAFAALCAFHLFAVQLRNFEWRSDDALYPTAVDLAPRSARVQANFALVLYERGDFAAAEEHARLAISLWPPGTLDSLGVLAASLDGLGRTQEAERTFSAAYALGNDVILAGQYATFLARQGKFEAALQVVQRERARSPA